MGLFFDAKVTPHGFLLHEGTFTPIDAPGATGTEAFGINKIGQIVGTAFLASCTDSEGFLAQ